MSIRNLLRLFFSPKKDDLFKSPLARRYLSKRILTLPFGDRPKKSPYANERFADELPQDLAWIRRRNFIVLGDNWLERENRRPVAFMWHFNDWKRDFIPGFLPEYRTAALKRRTPIWAIWIACRRFRNDGVVFITWSYNESLKLKVLRKLLGVDLYRVEDGFVRSAALGARHTPPESWVLDKRAMYFDGRVPSDLETILNTYDFEAAPHLEEQSRLAISLIRELGTTKYNLRTADTAVNILGPKAKKRVLVIGQVESDASIAKGNARGWTNDLLLQLAMEENPGAEIIYRPHPDVAAGLREKGRNTLPVNVILLDKVEISLREVFDLIDHAYTITSLSGFEALLHGVKVTVVGAPFYAGWGLTDDRQEHPRRQRQLTLQQLFAGAYIVYPRYRGTPEGDNWLGLVAAILAVTGDAEIELKKAYQNSVSEDDLEAVYRSRYWPALLTDGNRELLNSDAFHQTLQKAGAYHLVGSAPRAARSFLAYILAGRFRENDNLFVFLRSVRALLPLEDFGQLLSDLWQLDPRRELIEHWIWYSEKSGSHSFSGNDLNRLVRSEFKNADSCPDVSAADLAVAVHKLNSRKLQDAENELKRIALAGAFSEDILWSYAEICRLRFDFPSAKCLLEALHSLNVRWRRGAVLSELLTASVMDGSNKEALLTVSAMSRSSSDRLQTVLAVERDLIAAYGPIPFIDAFLAAGQETGSGSQNLMKARGLILSERHAEAEKLLRNSLNQRVDRQKFTFLLSQALSFQGKLGEARKLLSATLKNLATPQLMSEAMRVAIMAGDYEWASSLIDRADALDIDLSEVNRRKVALGLGRIKESYLSFRKSKRTDLIEKYLGERYVQSFDAIREKAPDYITVVAAYGPGDEIRFASLYRAIIAALAGIKVQFTCDPRLESMLKRSLPDIKFIPTERLRSLSRQSELSKFNRLPGSDLHVFFDNYGWDAVNASPAVALDTDLLGDVMEGYESFAGTPYLRPHPIRVEAAREKLSSFGKPIVGISWRSSLTTHSRNEHYLEIDMLMPVFEIEGIQFVNLQYDDCRNELDYVESRLPGRLVDLEGVDQYNDFESVAAYMEHMDLIISPVTTVTELAGALGRPTWLLSNSSELHWRVRPDNGRDVWHNSIEHIEGEVLGDKNSLVEKLRHSLQDWVDKRIEAKKPSLSDPISS